MPPQRFYALLTFVGFYTCCYPASVLSEESEAGKDQRVFSPQAMILFDASQSMYGKIPGVRHNKFELAKDLLEQIFAQWPLDIRLGFMAYGHRGRAAPQGDRCKDIEVLVPVGPMKEALMRRKVQGLRARGATPLCAALEKATEAVNAPHEPAHIVLISDGAEECGGDLEETVHRLAGNSRRLTIHILSLGQTAENNHVLQKATALTEGTFHAVNEAAQALPALLEITSKIVASTNVVITAHTTWEDEEPAAKSFEWRVYSGEPDEHGRYLLFANSASPRLRLQALPGLYWITARSDEALYSMKAFVDDATPFRHRLSLTKGKLLLNLPETFEGDLVVQSAAPVEDEANPTVKRSRVTGTQTYELPEGVYRVTLKREAETVATLVARVEAERERHYELKLDQNARPQS